MKKYPPENAVKSKKKLGVQYLQEKVAKTPMIIYFMSSIWINHKANCSHYMLSQNVTWKQIKT